MKQQFRKGFRQVIGGKTYQVFTLKLDAGTKILIKNEVIINDTKARRKVHNKI